MIRAILISAFLIVGVISIQAQQAISIDDLIKKVYEEQSEDIPNEYKMPWLEEINVRSETRDWRLREQRYSLRLRPISLGERRASSKLYNSWQQEIMYLKQDRVYDKVADIHEDWIKQDFISRRILLNKEILDLLNDVEKVAVKQSAINADKLSSLLTVRNRMATINNYITLKATSREKVLKELSKSIEGDYSIAADTIDIESYMQAIKEVLILPSKANVSQSDFLDLQTLDNEMELERAEQNRVLDFVALQYRGPHDNDLEERVSLGMSFNLPFFTSKKLSIAKLQVEKEREQYRMEERKEESLQKIINIKSSILTQLNEYDSYLRLYTNIERENLQLINNMEEQSFINPTIRLNHEIQVLDHKIALLNLKENMIQSYLEYLKATDKYQLGITNLSSSK